MEKRWYDLNQKYLLKDNNGISHMNKHAMTYVENNKIKYLSGIYDLTFIYFLKNDKTIKRVNNKLLNTFKTLTSENIGKILDDDFLKAPIYDYVEFPEENFLKLKEIMINEYFLLGYILGIFDFTEIDIKYLIKNSNSKKINIKIETSSFTNPFPFFILLFLERFQKEKKCLSFELNIKNIENERNYFIGKSSDAINFTTFCKKNKIRSWRYGKQEKVNILTKDILTFKGETFEDIKKFVLENLRS